jgi:hypothetical protein
MRTDDKQKLWPELSFRWVARSGCIVVPETPPGGLAGAETWEAAS